jgi:hypothetical protein
MEKLMRTLKEVEHDMDKERIRREKEEEKR